ncbi:hypothetical protein ACLHZW_17480 [Aeromonas media]|uniref:hypothetical protein n=1 Tax=Aeromonas media TaxID=651 RepID=UPI003D050B58
MGDWEDVFGESGMQADFAPWDSPCWNDDWEHELRENGNLTVREWNREGRGIKKGEKGRWLPCAKVTVFAEAQTYAISDNKMRFDTFREAMDWAKAHPGVSITRSHNGEGFVEK